MFARKGEENVEISNLTMVLLVIGANFILIMAMIGTTICVFSHSDKKTAVMLKSMQDDRKNFQENLSSIKERSKK